MTTIHELADSMLDEWARTLSHQTEDEPGDVFDTTGRQALRSYLVAVVGHEDTVELSQEFPGEADRHEWALSLRHIGSALDELAERTAASDSAATQTLVRGLRVEQLEREAAFGRFIAQELAAVTA